MTDTKREFVDKILALQNKLAFIIENGNCNEQRKAIEWVIRLDILLDGCTTVQ